MGTHHPLRPQARRLTPAGDAIRTDAEHARALDAADPLAAFRGRFAADEQGLTYLDGNSLGRAPKAALERLHEVAARQWGGRLIRAWNEGWLGLAQRVGAKVAKLLGAGEDEVIVADSTSVNLFKLAVAALRARPGRRTVVTDEFNFPSDVYVLQSALEVTGPVAVELWATSSAPDTDFTAKLVDVFPDGQARILVATDVAARGSTVLGGVLRGRRHRRRGGSDHRSGAFYFGQGGGSVSGRGAQVGCVWARDRPGSSRIAADSGNRVIGRKMGGPDWRFYG